MGSSVRTCLACRTCWSCTKSRSLVRRAHSLRSDSLPIISMPTDHRLLSLLHLCDSLFPTGSFAHSDGLEAATAAGLIATVDDLHDWMTVCLEENLGRIEGPVVWIASTARWDELMTLDEELNAL